MRIEKLRRKERNREVEERLNAPNTEVIEVLIGAFNKRKRNPKSPSSEKLKKARLTHNNNQQRSEDKEVICRQIKPVCQKAENE